MYGMRALPGGINTIFSLLILLLIIKTITILISMRATLQSERMGEIQSKIAEINAKYKNLNDSLSKQRKQMEIMTIYKKNNVRPLAMIEQIFVTLPIFLIVYRIVSITRPIKATFLFGF
jgi:YidC/Oxa1 family membrane protein insertase